MDKAYPAFTKKVKKIFHDQRRILTSSAVVMNTSCQEREKFFLKSFLSSVLQTSKYVQTFCSVLFCFYTLYKQKTLLLYLYWNCLLEKWQNTYWQNPQILDWFFSQKRKKTIKVIFTIVSTYWVYHDCQSHVGYLFFIIL